MIDRLKRNPNKLNFFLDATLFVAFVVEMEEHFTGLRVHELLGLVFALAALVHIVLHWSWVVGITRRFFSRLFHESRLNYVLNAVLAADMIVVVATGILISRTLGLSFAVPEQVETIHLFASHFSLVLIGAHVALHYKWIFAHGQKYLLPGRPTPTNATPSRRAQLPGEVA